MITKKTTNNEANNKSLTEINIKKKRNEKKSTHEIRHKKNLMRNTYTINKTQKQ